MKPVKEFDCIKMKDKIQAQFAESFPGRSDAEVRRQIQKKLAASDSPVARLWRRIQRSEKLTPSSPRRGKRPSQCAKDVAHSS